MNMAHRKWLACLGAVFLLGGCASTPAPVFYTLDNGIEQPGPQGATASIVITQTNLPELIDRPQLVTRTANNQVRIKEQQRWGEPLRRAIPRVLSMELGRKLDSGRIVSVPIDAQRIDADFRLSLEVQRLEVVEGRGADADIVWRLESRHGKVVLGRSVLHEAERSAEPSALIAAQRRALAVIAAEIADQVRRWQEAAK